MILLDRVRFLLTEIVHRTGRNLLLGFLGCTLEFGYGAVELAADSIGATGVASFLGSLSSLSSLASLLPANAGAGL